jgi:hypothetical protein
LIDQPHHFLPAIALGKLSLSDRYLNSILKLILAKPDSNADAKTVQLIRQRTIEVNDTYQ